MLPSADAALSWPFVRFACDELLAGLGQACLGGGILVLLVWAACRWILPRLPARFRFAFWWMACAKLVLGVFCAGLVPFVLPLPFLPLPQTSLGAVRRVVPPAAVDVVRPLLRSKPRPSVPLPATAAAVAGLEIASFPVSVKGNEAAATAETIPPRVLPAAAAPDEVPTIEPERLPLWWGKVFLAFVYLAGLVLFLARAGRAAQNGRRIVENAHEITDESVLQAAEQITHALWGRDNKTPRLLQSAHAASPFVAGMVRPALILPVGFAQTVTAAQLRLVLAHEMAHLKRGDLWLCLVPQIAQAVLWFFPLAHLACRECLEAGEEACDARALQTCPQSERSDLGHLLLRFSLNRSPLLPPALGMAAAPGFARLKRRLHALQPVAPMSRVGKAGTFLLAVGFGAAVLPWRISGAAAQAAVGPLPNAPSEEKSIAAASLPRYEIIDLGTPDETYSDACAVSDTGVVVGTTGASATNGRGIAFAYDALTNRRVEVGAAPYRRSIAAGISPGGTVAGIGYNRRSRPQAFVWHSGKTGQTARTFLWPLSGFRYSRASGINDQDQVVGSVHGLPKDGVLPARAFVYDKGAMTDLGTLGGPYSHASAISSSGLVVGKADVPRKKRGETTETHAFALQTKPDGTAAEPMRDLGTLPGGKNSRAWSVNAPGEVVGFSEANGNQHAFLQTGDAPMQDLGTLPGKQNSIAYAISDQGWIVGTASDKKTASSAPSAVLWVRTANAPGVSGDTVLVDLNERIPQNSGWTLETARGINRSGWIVGQGRVRGKQRAFLLKPVSR